MRLLLPFFALLLAVLPLYGHYPENTVFKIFQFPDDRVPAMDGDLGDWDIVPQDYFVDSQGMIRTRSDSHKIAVVHGNARTLEAYWFLRSG